MADVQPENGTAPLAYALMEALMKDGAASLVDRIRWWVLRNTYGRRGSEGRRKTCSFTWYAVARAIGADRREVSRTGKHMLSTRRLYLDSAGRIGVLKDYDQWAPWGTKRSRGQKPPIGGKSPPNRGEMPPKQGAKAHRSSYAREVLAVSPIRSVLTERTLGTTAKRTVGGAPGGEEERLLSQPYPVPGAYKDVEIRELPADYCRWALDMLTSLGPQLRQALELRVARKDAEARGMNRSPKVRQALEL